MLTSLLAAFGNAIGRGAYFRVGADLHHLKLNVVLVGDTSKGRKGMSWGFPRELMRAADKRWIDERVLHGLSSGEGLIYAVRDRLEGENKKARRWSSTRAWRISACSCWTVEMSRVQPEHSYFLEFCRNFGSAPGRIRTSDSRFRKPLLYPLSYRRIKLGYARFLPPQTSVSAVVHQRSSIMPLSSPIPGTTWL